MRIVPPHEIWVEELHRVSKRSPHEARPMRSGESKGPLKLFICDFCRDYTYTTSKHAPVCTGALTPPIFQGGGRR